MSEPRPPNQQGPHAPQPWPSAPTQHWVATPPEPRRPGRGPERRLGSRNLHNLPALVVLACAAGGLVAAVIIPEHWLRGVLFMAGALILAGAFRLALPTRQAGILAVRGRMIDVLCYVGIAAALWLVGLLIPPARS